MICMDNNYILQEFKFLKKSKDKLEREKIANDALSISMLDAKKPSDETMELISSIISTIAFIASTDSVVLV